MNIDFLVQEGDKCMINSLKNKRDNMLDDCSRFYVDGNFLGVKNQLEESKDIRTEFTDYLHSCSDVEQIIILASKFIETCNIFEKLLHEELIKKELGR